MSRGLFCRKSFLCEQEVFLLYHCWILKEVFIIIILKFSEELSILHSRFSENIFTKVFPLKFFKITCSILNFERTSVGKFATTVVGRWTNSVTFFPDKGQILAHLWTLIKKLAFGRFFFRRVCKICSLRVSKICLIIWRTLFPGKIFFFFRTIIKNV